MKRVKIVRDKNENCFSYRLDLDEFNPFLKHDDELKPIWIFAQGKHGSPRFPTTRQTLIKFFKENDIMTLLQFAME